MQSTYVIHSFWENLIKQFARAEKSKWRALILIGLTTQLLTISACAKTDRSKTSIAAIDAGNSHIECLVFKPVFWSKRDTKNTQDQLIEHNVIWDALCNPESNTQ